MNKQYGPLYLVSQSLSRQALLRMAGIPFTIMPHMSQEIVEVPVDPFSEYVKAIAVDKMRGVTLPPGKVRGEKAFVLTADTLVCTHITKTILGKPDDIHDARRMIALLRNEPAIVITGVCIRRYSWGSSWVLEKETLFHSETEIEFIIPESDVDWYFEQEPHALKAAGAAVIENIGVTYLKNIKGSFSGTLGLPFYEVRVALREIGLFN
jgi:septum formation protein